MPQPACAAARNVPSVSPSGPRGGRNTASRTPSEIGPGLSLEAVPLGGALHGLCSASPRGLFRPSSSVAVVVSTSIVPNLGYSSSASRSPLPSVSVLPSTAERETSTSARKFEPARSSIRTIQSAPPLPREPRACRGLVAPPSAALGRPRPPSALLAPGMPLGPVPARPARGTENSGRGTCEPGLGIRTMGTRFF